MYVKFSYKFKSFLFRRCAIYEVVEIHNSSFTNQILFTINENNKKLNSKYLLYIFTI